MAKLDLLVKHHAKEARSSGVSNVEGTSRVMPITRFQLYRDPAIQESLMFVAEKLERKLRSI